MKCVLPFSSGWSPLSACWTASARHRLASSRRSRALRSPQLSQVPSPRTSPENLMHPHPHSQPPSPVTAHLSPFTPLTSCNLAMGMTVTPAAAAVVVPPPHYRCAAGAALSRAHELILISRARCSLGAARSELAGWSKVSVAATETRPLSDFYPGAPPILYAVRRVSGRLRTGLRPTRRGSPRTTSRSTPRTLALLRGVALPPCRPPRRRRPSLNRRFAATAAAAASAAASAAAASTSTAAFTITFPLHRHRSSLAAHHSPFTLTLTRPTRLLATEYMSPPRRRRRHRRLLLRLHHLRFHRRRLHHHPPFSPSPSPLTLITHYSPLNLHPVTPSGNPQSPSPSLYTPSP